MDLGVWKDWVLGFVVIAIIIGIGGTILQNVENQQCKTGVAGTGTTGVNPATGQCYANASTIASNSTDQGLTGINTFGTWLPTIAVILAASVVIGIIVHYFAG